MNTTVTGESALVQGGDCLVVGVDASGFCGDTGTQVDAWSGGAASRAMKAGFFGHRMSDSYLIPLAADDAPPVALLVGVDAREKIKADTAYALGGRAVRRLIDKGLGKLVFAVSDIVPVEHQTSFIAGAVMACEGQDLYRESPATKAPKQLVFAGVDESQAELGVILGEAINATRRLVNEPPNYVYPESFVDRVCELVKDLPIEVEVWDEKKLATERCHAMLAVAQGSSRPPRLLMLRYRGGADSAPIALVGKGVTFDSGGLSLKPTDSMTDMKCDMAGAATVVGALLAIAKLKIKANVNVYCGLVENMISGGCYKLGDVFTARSGKTIEILNTDAEGRVVLADVLDVAREAQPQGIIDLATLTGACMVALGLDVVGLFANHDKLAEQVAESAQGAGELLWRMPMFAEYNDLINSNVADIKNVGAGRWAGAITAAKFLEQFVGDTPWVHLDIAGPAFADSAKPHRDAGATGVMVRTLVKLIQSRT